MVTIPGVAVGLLGILGVLVAFGLIQLTRYWLRPLLYAFAAILRPVPVVGGWAAKQVLRFERIVDSWLASAAVHTERLAVGWFHGLLVVVQRLGDEIAGLATDAYGAANRLVRATIPRLIAHARAELLRLIRAAESRALAAARRVGQLAAAVEHRLAELSRHVEGELARLGRAIEHRALAAVHTAVAVFWSALHAVERAVEAVEYRIGQVEAQVFDAVWPELRRLGDDLRPDRLFERLFVHAWQLVPHEARTFLAWLWYLLTEFGEFFAAVVRGDWPPEQHHTAGVSMLHGISAEAERFAAGIRDELGT